MTASKPPVTLKIAIQTIGTREDVADLFARLNELGVVDRSLDIVLNAGFYVEEQGRDTRRQVIELLKTHPAVFRKKSGAHLASRWMADERLFETVADMEEAAEDEDDEDDGQLSLDDWARDQAERGWPAALASRQAGVQE